MPAELPTVCINKIQLSDGAQGVIARIDILIKEVVSTLEQSFFRGPHADLFRIEVIQKHGSRDTVRELVVDHSRLEEYINRAAIVGGEYLLSIPMVEMFHIDEQDIRDLHYVVTPIINGEPEINRLLARHAYTEYVIEDRELVDTTSGYTLRDGMTKGEVWSGAKEHVDYRQSSPDQLSSIFSGYTGYVAIRDGATSPFSRLREHSIPNNKVIDFRSRRMRKDSPYKSIAEIHSSDSPASAVEQTFNIYSSISDRLSVKSFNSYLAMVGACYTEDGFRRIQFDLNFEEMIADKLQAFPSVDILDIMSMSKIKNLRVLRRKVADRQELLGAKAVYKPDNDEVPIIVISDDENNGSIGKRRFADQDNSLEVASLQELPNSAGESVQTFVCKERLDPHGYKGLYQYGVEIEIENGLLGAVKRDLANLDLIFKDFSYYYNRASSRINGVPNYDRVMNRFSNEFKIKFGAEFESGSRLYNRMIDYAFLCGRYFSSETVVLTLVKSAAMVHPESATPDSILEFLGLVKNLQHRLNSINSAISSPRKRVKGVAQGDHVATRISNRGRPRDTISFRKFFEDSDCVDEEGASLRAQENVRVSVNILEHDTLSYEDMEDRETEELHNHDISTTSGSELEGKTDLGLGNKEGTFPYFTATSATVHSLGTNGETKTKLSITGEDETKVFHTVEHLAKGSKPAEDLGFKFDSEASLAKFADVVAINVLESNAIRAHSKENYDNVPEDDVKDKVLVDTLQELDRCADNVYVNDDMTEMEEDQVERFFIEKKKVTPSLSKAVSATTEVRKKSTPVKKYDLHRAKKAIEKTKRNKASKEKATKEYFKNLVPPQIRKLYVETEKEKKKPGSSKELAKMKSPDTKAVQNIKHGTLTQIEYHSGYEKNSNGLLNLKKPIWNKLERKDFDAKKAAGETLTCRIKKYADPILGHSFDKSLKVLISNKQFTISPKKKVAKPKKISMEKKKKETKKNLTKAFKAIRKFKTADIATRPKIKGKSTKKSPRRKAIVSKSKVKGGY